MAAPAPVDWRVTLRQRVAIVAVTTAAWVGCIEARLVHLQIFKRADLVARAERQQMRTQPVPPKYDLPPGSIVYRNLAEAVRAIVK